MTNPITPLSLINDPMLASAIGGTIAFLLQVVADKPWWTANTRRWVAITLALIVSVGVWYAGAYPAGWRIFAAQAATALAAAQVAFAILKAIKLPDGNTIVDWLGMKTPGGEEYKPRH